MRNSSPSTRLSPRLPQPVDLHSPSGPIPALDISPLQNTSLHQYDNDVVRELSLPPAPHPSAPTRPHVSIQPPQAHYLTGPHNVSIDSLHSRPRTPPVHHSQHNFTAQHGLPSFLPPPPRTTFYTHQGPSHPPLPAKDSEPEGSNIASYLDSLLRGSYSQMLSQKQETDVRDSVAEPQTEIELSLDDMLQADYLETHDPTTFEEYLTSPLIQDDSPEETPFLPTPYEDAWTSPMVDHGDDSFGMNGTPLFGAVVKPAADDKQAEYDSINVLELLHLFPRAEPDPNKMDAQTPALDPLDAAQYTMPETPAIPPATLYNEPRLPSNPPNSSSSTSSASPMRSTKPLPTGHRRNITPASLVPLDAPTQPRQYVTPSATSRKAVPAAFKGKKRAISEVIGDDELDGDVSPDAIEAKRRQNTLAARRSRQRKLEHVRELEETVGRLTADRDEWMNRAYDAEAKLRVHGIT